ncbi:MAG: hypothetical protein WC657_01515 [Candidatus Paceibacterota bacterium]|jgi:hypothetical protein
MKKITHVSDKMQKDYQYELVAPIGKKFDPQFTPDLTPKQMLELGVFGGRYMRDCQKEFPKNWFIKAKFHPSSAPGHNKNLNYFKVDASQSLSIWQNKGWIYLEDLRGWFQWYCRYYMGRRIPIEDERQIKRWKAMTRHLAQISKNCRVGDFACRPKQRQALLHWAYDTRKL